MCVCGVYMFQTTLFTINTYLSTNCIFCNTQTNTMSRDAAKQRFKRERRKNKNELSNCSISTAKPLPLPFELKVRSFADCTYIQGTTLSRYWERPNPTSYKGHYFLVYTIPRRQQNMQCDSCVRQHQPTNLTCSATQSLPSMYVDDAILYNFYNKHGPHYHFEIVQSFTSPKGRVSAVVCILTKI